MARTFLFCSFVAISFTMVASMQVQFKDCGSKGANLTNVTITPCSAEPCEFIRNVNITTAIFFKALTYSRTATIVAHVLAGKEVIPLPVDQPDACKIMPCPVTPGNPYQLVGSKTVPSSIPPVPIPLVMQMQLIGDNNSTLVCVQYRFKV